MFNNIIARLSQQGKESPSSAAEREAFNNHLAHDAKEVITKMMVSTNAELKQVVDEIVAQATEFWQHQLRKTEEAHKSEVSQLKAEVVEANKQLDETVKMYNQVVQNLNAQLAEAHEATDAAQRMAEAKLKAAAAIQMSSSADVIAKDDASNTKTQLQELTKQLAAAQTAARDSDLKSQQKRLILVQTVEKQHQEIEDLKKQLKKAQERDAKLTQVSEHLLSKQAQYVAHVKSLQSQLAALKGESPSNADDTVLAKAASTGTAELGISGNLAHSNSLIGNAAHSLTPVATSSTNPTSISASAPTTPLVSSSTFTTVLPANSPDAPGSNRSSSSFTQQPTDQPGTVDGSAAIRSLGASGDVAQRVLASHGSSTSRPNSAGGTAPLSPPSTMLQNAANPRAQELHRLIQEHELHEKQRKV